MEMAHALAKAERTGVLKPPQGMNALADSLRIGIEHYLSIPLLPRAFEISSIMRIDNYDGLYIALAEREGCQVVTADQKILKGLPAVSPDQLSSS